MTTATALAPAKKETPATETGKLPLKGGKEGVTKSLDNKSVIKSPPDPKVVKEAEILAGILDRRAKIDKEAQEAGVALLKAFDLSKRQKKVRIVGEVKTYWFSKATLSKLVIEKKDANEA